MRQGAYIFGCSGPQLDPNEAAFFAASQPWGFILFARNIQGPKQLQRLTTDLRASVGRNAPVLIDQEGGRVQRLGPPHWRNWLPPLDQAAKAGSSAAAARSFYLRYRLIAHDLRAVGIDVNCAPCADVATAGTHPFLRNRCLGTNADAVALNARAAADGLLAGGVVPVIKHIPGHGRATVDSHRALPHVSAPAHTLSETDFAPFRALADLPLGMGAHVVYDALDSSAPATMSPRVTGLIRRDIGFDGLLMTDDISMGALSGDMRTCVRAALAAGNDLVLHCNGDLREMQAVAAEAGRMSDPAQHRADRALVTREIPDSIDISKLEADLEALLSGQGPEHRHG